MAYTSAASVTTASASTGSPVGDAGGDHVHSVGGIVVNIPSLGVVKSQFAHTHGITLPSNFGSHTHTVSFSAHTHTFTIPAHKHKFTIPAHKHSVTIPAHSHKITPGIFESGRAKNFTIYVDGVEKVTIAGTSYNGDITEWLVNDRREIPRNSWIDVDIRPDDLAYVQASVFVQGFVQSRGGGNF